jgi:outer membrane protein OmpA-like peptidoglycan-associated protein
VKKLKKILMIVTLSVFLAENLYAWEIGEDKEAGRKQEKEELQKKFSWWPTDALPGPVEDKEKGGYWWWPTTPGSTRPWGNRGWVYIRKIIFDYKADELPAPKPSELRAALVIKKIVKNVKIYFDYDKDDLREDAIPVLEGSLKALKKNPEASVLITGNCDIRGSEAYNEKLGKKRGETVKKYMLDNAIPEERIIIVSRGKLDALAHVTDLAGMQKDRNAQFMVAEVEETMIPYNPETQGGSAEEAAIPANVAPLPAEDKDKAVIEKKFVEEKTENVEGAIKVSTREYTIQEGDSLWKIAAKELGSGNRWEYLYEFNKEKISNPNKLKKGTVILIPVE